MFHSESREVGVGNQDSNRVPTAEHLLKDRPVLIRGLDDADARLVEPALHTLNGLLEKRTTPDNFSTSPPSPSPPHFGALGQLTDH